MSNNNNFLESHQNETRNEYLRMIALNSMTETERKHFLKNEKDNKKAVLIALIIVMVMSGITIYFLPQILWFFITL